MIFVTGTRACLPERDCGWSPLASGLRQCMPQPQYVALHRLTEPLESKSRYDVARACRTNKFAIVATTTPKAPHPFVSP
jgi:hypothetical protein